ncbi:unnamed protein product [marine sediment metagenome]|uniref:Uncharacterized protein n=1 Tax=marine sediment metagenome TaxID=412755 RepID=X1NCU6_9ZZZZ
MKLLLEPFSAFGLSSYYHQRPFKLFIEGSYEIRLGGIKHYYLMLVVSSK